MLSIRKPYVHMHLRSCCTGGSSRVALGEHTSTYVRTYLKGCLRSLAPRGLDDVRNVARALTILQ